MGRLRNLSETFKSAAFHHSNPSTSSLARPASHSQSQIVDKEYLVPHNGNGNGNSNSNSNEPFPPVSPDSPSSANHRPDRADRTPSRPTSMIYTPPSMELGRDREIEELLPVFSFLSSHANKLYQEGYFLKLNDLDTQGRPILDRNWNECFAQLVGTILSLWDAAALDAAGQDGEVAPTFINLADASIKMIETLPTRNPDVQPLQNVLSISTAGKNRYLFHFNSLHSLTQWTAGLRLAMFEHASLQELYTGSLIAGKGKLLNNIRAIMERSKFKTEDWARVRFGAGTPWRRCWCIIEPPDEKEWQKTTKSLKKKSVYDRPHAPKGEIKFYDTKKTKKATPIATITDAYSAYAIYPQAKPLIDQSTLVKVEGRITIHSSPESQTEGFVFVMPEGHAAVSGFEMMLRWLFPVYDVFHLYGRPQRLIADTWDPRGLMFAMPKERRYGYLDIIDVAALLHTQGSDRWSEREWRRQLKDMTAKRANMTAQSRSASNIDDGRARSQSRPGVHYADADADAARSPVPHHQHNVSTDAVFASPVRATTNPLSAAHLSPQATHNRSVSESVAYVSPTKARRQPHHQHQQPPYNPSRLSTEYQEDAGPAPIATPPDPPAGSRRAYKAQAMASELEAPDRRSSSDSDSPARHTNPEEVQRDIRAPTPPGPVVAPPSFQHHAGQVPQKRPDARQDLRRENSRMSNATLSQMADVSSLAHGGAAGHAAMVAWNGNTSGGSTNLPPNPNPHPNAFNAGTAAAGPRPSQGEDQGYYRGVNDELPPHHAPGPSANVLASQEMVADAVSSHARPPAESALASSRPSPDHLTRPRPIARKPVPGPAAVRGDPSSSLAPPAPPHRSHSPDSMSRYSDSNDAPDSPGSPNYDSPPEDPDRSTVAPRKMRTGALKTVGDPTWGSAAASSSTSSSLPNTTRVDIPVVDFGTTFTPTLTPGNSRPPTAAGLGGRQSPWDHQPHTAPATPQTRSPRDGKISPGQLTPNDDKDRRSSYLDRMSPRLGLSRPASYVWQPGSSPRRSSPGGGLTAAEFVQQRAAVARVPSGYVPHRSYSSGKVESLPPAAAVKRRESAARSSSRNSVSIDLSAHLSAREQEHVARVTGGPLIQLSERNKTPDPAIGLIGAIEAREQEKRNAKEGLAGHLVHEAVAQRQAAERTYGYAHPPPLGAVPGMAADPRHSGQWFQPPSSMSWASNTPQYVSQPSPTPPWPAYPAYPSYSPTIHAQQPRQSDQRRASRSPSSYPGVFQP